jgi:hypothetical protein
MGNRIDGETQYSSIDQLTKAVNAGMSKEIQTKVKFSYNHSSRKILVDVKHGTTLWFTGELATVLGFDCSLCCRYHWWIFLHVCLH